MSTHIEDQQVAVRIPMAPNWMGATGALLLIAESGDNNVSTFVERNLRTYEVRAKSWSPVTFRVGEWEAMRDIVERAASCEGGMLRLAGSSHTKSENYIKKWRSAVEAPYTLDDLAAAGIEVASCFTIDEADVEERMRERYEKLVAAHPPESIEGSSKRAFTFNLGDPQHVLRIHEAYYLGGDYAHFRFFKVRGPREAVVRRLRAA